jgi:prolyl oligopeptidase
MKKPCLNLMFLPLMILALGVASCASKTASKKEGAATMTQDNQDLYLEEIYGKQAMMWVKKQNLKSTPFFTEDPRFLTIQSQILKILDDPKKILYVSFFDGWAYNFWRDAKNTRGLWRRTAISAYLKGVPDWEVLLDIDKLAKTENKNWIFAGSQIYKDRALINLSDGGKDAHVIREFDLNKKTFLADGFTLPEGKHSVSWIDESHLFLGLATPESETNDSGYALRTRVWQRGASPESAKIVFTSSKKDVWVEGYVTRDQENGPVRYRLLSLGLDFFNSENFILQQNGALIKLKTPTDASIALDGDHLYLTLKSPWHYKKTTYLTGSLLRLDLKKFIKSESPVEIVFTPTKNRFLKAKVFQQGRVFLLLSEDVANRAVEAIRGPKSWTLKEIPLPTKSTIEFEAHSDMSDWMTFSSEGFVQPKTIFAYNLKTNSISNLEQAPSYFDSAPYEVNQFFAKSKDGTRIPYYQISKKNLALDGSHPTLINAYGGFEASLDPRYLPNAELGWLRNGGVWVVANIRGGSEYGPEWHTAVLKENRQKVYDDFFAVAEDLIKRKVTSPVKLGAKGRSNGGLLMGVALTQRPDLFNAIAIQVPLLDMLRYHKLLAGASWIGEYGDPEDVKMRKSLEAYSPYQNIMPGRKYPEVFFMTSTGDDRVHPGHARRAAAKMESLGYPFFYYENTEGGHGGSANNAQTAKWGALEHIYFLKKLQ